ncbi:MAG: glycosyltransferase family 39 protein [Candidatus Omnitrophica bacterium]|nr:glycosyltransferase family 39 protein [Candidatus Omnitrophota bacterium]
MSFLFIVPFALLVLQALNGLGCSLDYDELYSFHYFMSKDSLRDVLCAYRMFNNHLGYSALAWFCRMGLGSAEWVLRLPALAFALGALGLTWSWVRKNFGMKAAFLSSLLLVLSPEFVRYSYAARGYSGLLCLTLLSTIVFLRLLKNPRRLDFALYVLIAVAAIYVHLYSVCVVGVQLLMLGRLGAQRHAAPWISWTMVFLSIGVLSFLCYLPVLESFMGAVQLRGQGPWNPGFVLESFAYLSGRTSGAETFFWMGLAGAGLWPLWKRDRLLAVYLGLLFTVPLALVIVLHPWDLYHRFFFFLLPYYVLLIALGLAQTVRFVGSYSSGRVRQGIGVLGSAVLLALLADGAKVQWQRAEEIRYREVIRALEEGASPETALAAVGRNAEMLEYYFTRPWHSPKTLEELLTLAKASDGIHCVYHEITWNSPGEQEIRAYLCEHAQMRRMNWMSLFYMDAGDVTDAADTHG